MILLCHKVVILLLDSPIPARKTTLEYLDATDVLNITTILTLEVFHSAIARVHARQIWLILGNATKPHGRTFIWHYFVLLALSTQSNRIIQTYQSIHSKESS